MPQAPERRFLSPKWTPVTESPIFAVVISNFNLDSSGLHQLRVTVGDTVLIYEELEGWFYGCLSHERKQMGIFPKNFVVLRDSAIISACNIHNGSYETLRPKETPLVHEMTATLREWGSIIEERFVDPRSYDSSPIRKLLYELIDYRSQVMSGNLPIDNLRELQREINSKIDHGNALLGLDVIVRDDQGNILQPMQTSTIDLYRAHVRAHQNIQRMNMILPDRDSNASGISIISASNHLHHPPSVNHRHSFTSMAKVSLHLTVFNFTCPIGQDAELLIALYDGREQKFISENYLVNWGRQGFVKDVDQLNNLKVLFTDLGSKDLQREKILLVCQVIRIGAMELKETADQASGNSRSRSVNPGKKLSDGLRRPFGVAAMDVTEYLTEAKVLTENSDQICVPFIACGERDTLESVLKKFLRPESRKDGTKGPGLWVYMKVLHGDFNNPLSDDYTPRFATSPALPIKHVARKMGFPDVILPGDVRNDLYLTLNSAEFNPKAYSSNAKNIEVTVRVCNEKGQVVPNGITVGAGAESLSEYKSVVYYHDEKPKWAETFKITIPIEEFYGSHIRFLFKHRSSNESKDRNERPFALSFIRLGNTNGTTINDQTHELLVYRIEKKFDEASESHHSQYMKLPSTRSELDSLVSGNPHLKTVTAQFSTNTLSLQLKDMFFISSVICSTKLTQNFDLMNLLAISPQQATDKEIENCLLAFQNVDGEEIVKFLQDAFDALFKIFVEKDTDRINWLFFESLIRMIGLISDPKYENFRTVLDTYVNEGFSWPTAYEKLIHVLKTAINDVINDEDRTNGFSSGSERGSRGSFGRLFDQDSRPREIISKIMKSLEFLMKFIVQSRYLHSMMDGGAGQRDFDDAMISLFDSFCDLMSASGFDLEVLHKQCLKHFPSVIPDVLTVYDGPSLSEILSLLLSNVPFERLKSEKLAYISDIIHTDCLFRRSDCRQHILPVIVDHIRGFMLNKDQFEECVEVLSEILRLLYTQDSGSTDEDLKDIMNAILRPVIKAVIKTFGQKKNGDEMMRKLVSILISILNQMRPRHYKEYFDRLFAAPSDLMDFLIEIMMVFKNLVDEPVFPKDCIEMILHQNHVMLTSMRHISRCIRDKFSNPFEYQLWNNFFHCAISFLTQPSLQLETFTANKRNRIICSYGDLRKEAAIEVRSMWYNLGNNKVKFVPGIVGPFVEMTLIPDMALRKETIPIFFDMMLSEIFEPVKSTTLSANPGHAIKGHFRDFEREMITQLDKLVEGGRGDQEYNDLIKRLLGDLWENHQFREQGLNFVLTINRLLRRLLEYREVASEPTEENKDNSMLCIKNILEFYHEIGREELHIRYLYKLVELHRESHNFVEAAYTLKQHNRLLKWKDAPLDPVLRSPLTDACDVTERTLKQRLYIDIIDLFDLGKLWEEGLRLCKELARQYEEELHDYSQLSELHLKMSKYYNNIMTTLRPESEYFRVAFCGKGFPAPIQNKTFIYRGKEYERIGTCISRLMNHYPKAKLLNSSDLPGPDIMESNDQYLLVTTVQPVMCLKEELQTKSISDQILKYYKTNEIQKFSFSKPFRKATTNGASDENEFASMWIERTYFTTAYPLPGILRMFAVVETLKMELSPIECAVEAVESTNNEIRGLILQLIRDSATPLNNLSLRLQGVISAFVNGGMINYEKAFFSESFLRENSGNTATRDGIARLKKLIAQQIPLLEVGLDYHQQRMAKDMKPLHDHLVSQFKKMRVATEEKYGREPIPPEILEAQAKRKEQTARQSSEPVDDTPAKMTYRKRTGNGNWISTGNFTNTISKTFSRRQESKDHGDHKRKGSSQFFMDLNSNEQEEEKQSLGSSQTSLMSCQPQQQQLADNNNGPQTQSVSKDVIELSETHPRIRPLRPETRRRPSSGGSRNGNLSGASPAFTSNVSIDSLDSSCDQSMITSTASINPDPAADAFTPPRLPPKSNTSIVMTDLTTIGPPEAAHRTRIKSIGSNPIDKPRMTLPPHQEHSSPGSPASVGSNGSPQNGVDRQAPPPVVPRKSLSADKSTREEDVYKNINSIRPNRRPCT